MAFIISLIGFLIVLTPVVFFHELGHFWAARGPVSRLRYFLSASALSCSG